MGNIETVSKTFLADYSKTEEVIGFLEQTLDVHNVDMKTKSAILICCEEIFTNIAKFAYKDGNGTTDLLICFSDGEITLEFIDSGVEFNPLENVDPDTSLTAEERSIGGLGIFMVKRMMNLVEYSFTDNKNHLKMTKKF